MGGNIKKLRKQDRAVVRTAPDVERRYRLNQIAPLEEEVEDLKEDMKVDQKLSASSTNAIANKPVTEALAEKVNKEDGKGLSTNDFTSAYKTKVDSIEKNAQVNVIEKIIVNGTEQAITNKTVNIDVSGGGSGATDVVVDNLDDNATDKAPSQRAVNEALTKTVEVVESGSNDNGSYIKYSDGTMIANKTVLGEVDIETSTMGGAFYYGQVNLGSFPVSFIEKPTVVVSPQTQSGTHYFLAGQSGAGYNALTNWGLYCLMRPAKRDALAYELNAMAIGRWKKI